MTPKLWRPFVNQLAANALPRRARLPLVTPEHVRGANQPMLVGGIQFGDVRAVREEPWSADKR
ncbi:MAG TPA: hypothetical protein VM939_07360, partial [Gemmatimonadaceae bacterium]|nr:hypothetical protein [Gemmatimonadaceae bacterium]